MKPIRNFLQSGGSTFALLATETDRIANSLNTLGEQIRGWAGFKNHIVIPL